MTTAVDSIFNPSNWNRTGSTQVKKDNVPIDIKISGSVSQSNASFCAYTYNEDQSIKKLGIIDVSILNYETCLKNSNNQELTNLIWKDDLTNKTNKVFVSFMESYCKETYKGVGTALIQAAIEYGFSEAKNYSGKVRLEACWNSHGFYYKLGMRAHEEWDEEKDDFVAKELEKAKLANREPKTTRMGSYFMQMPDPTIAVWKKRIQENPIFTRLETQKL